MPWKIAPSDSDPNVPRTLLEYDSMHQRVGKRGPEKTTIYAGDLYECEGTTLASGNTVNCSTERFKIYGAGKLVAVVTKGDFTNEQPFTQSWIRATTQGQVSLNVLAISK